MMLMAVLERVRELGMLMSIGMNKSKIFIMIVLETVILGHGRDACRTVYFLPYGGVLR